jgi:hypothetical protein
MTIWSDELCKEWGYERGQGFSKYVQYLSCPSHRKQPWMMDQSPTVWFSEGNDWTVDQLLAPAGMCPSKNIKPRRNGMTTSEMYDVMKVNKLKDPIDFIFWARKRKTEFGCDAAMNALVKTYTKSKCPLKPIQMFQFMMEADRETLKAVLNIKEPETELEHLKITFHIEYMLPFLENWKGHGAGTQNAEGVQIDPQIICLAGLSGSCKTTFLKMLFMEHFNCQRVWVFNKPEDIKDAGVGSVRAGDTLIFNELAACHFKNLSELKNFAERASGQNVEVRFSSVHIPGAVNIAFTTNASSKEEWLLPFLQTAEARAKSVAAQEDINAFRRKCLWIQIDFCLSNVPAVKKKFMATQCRCANQSINLQIIIYFNLNINHTMPS